MNESFQVSIPKSPLTNMSFQRFCLRWNNHQSNLLSVFDQLLHDESFVDVTLAVEGQLLKAHKMVLSACSPYFQALFVNHPDRHPIVILKDVPYNDMRSLLDFMYKGEVSVDQDRLTAFLRVAESLRIKGLTEVNEEKCDSITSSLTNQNANLQRLQQQFPKKMMNSMGNMLGNALMQPKRKRGRPRKLSGSSNGTPGDDFDKSDGYIQGSPEMLEVKMGTDGFAGNNSDSNSKDKEDDEKSSRVDGNGLEPVAGTSKEQFEVPVKSESEFQPSDLEEDEEVVEYLDLPSSLTVEVMAPKHESVIISTEMARRIAGEVVQVHEQEDDEKNDDEDDDPTTGIHFLTDEEVSNDNYERKKNELLEYITREDGSVICKLCGELLASRTHWYRHKYKLHVANFVNPAPLFKCKFCNVFFKSRKGFLGHIAARHSEDSRLVTADDLNNISIKEEVIETTTTTTVVEQPPGGNNKAMCNKQGRRDKAPSDWEEQRVREEKLVAAIIDRVRKECEAQGAAVTRRGYSRRSTVMMNTT